MSIFADQNRRLAIELLKKQGEVNDVKAQLLDANTRVGEALVENLSLLAQIVDLKTAGAEVPSYVPIKLQDAPRDGSPVIVETGTGQPLLVHWRSLGGDGAWVSQGAELTDISLTNLCLPITPWAAASKGGDS